MKITDDDGIMMPMGIPRKIRMILLVFDDDDDDDDCS